VEAIYFSFSDLVGASRHKSIVSSNFKSFLDECVDLKIKLVMAKADFDDVHHRLEPKGISPDKIINVPVYSWSGFGKTKIKKSKNNSNVAKELGEAVFHEYCNSFQQGDPRFVRPKTFRITGIGDNDFFVWAGQNEEEIFERINHTIFEFEKKRLDSYIKGVKHNARIAMQYGADPQDLHKAIDEAITNEVLDG
jgi:hypothetical protein